MGAPAVSPRTQPGRAPRRTTGPARRVRTPSRRAAAVRSRPSRAASTRGRAPAAGRRRSRITPPGGVAMIPVHAVGGAAGAVGGMADSGVVVGLTRGRRWIAVLGILLGGIVALNVWGLSMSASTTGSASKIDELERANTVLRAQIAKRSSSDRVQELAAGLGLETPTPKAVDYLKYRRHDPAKAAERLSGGEISVLTGQPIVPAFADPAATGGDPASSAATDPAAAPAPATDPAAGATGADPAASGPDPATGTAPAPAADGGVTP